MRLGIHTRQSRCPWSSAVPQWHEPGMPSDGGNLYLFTVVSDPTGFFLSRVDSNSLAVLASGQNNAIRPGSQGNHLELACRGNTIAAMVNEVRIAEVTDDTYKAGYDG